ncbi:MAG: hypothetical protein R3B72_40910 [Polyangiaceae bacterium]
MAEGRGSRILAGFANAVISRGLGRIRAWLRERLGDDADLESLRIEGTRAELLGAKLPFGDASLRIDRAQLALETEGSTPRVRLVELRGALCAGHGDATFEAPLELTHTRRDDPEAWVDGTLRVMGATWTKRAGVGESEPLEGTVEVKVSLQRWRLFDGHVEGSAASVWLEAEGAMDNSEGRALEQARLVFDKARAGHLLDAVHALIGRGPAPSAPLPWSALLTGEVVWQRKGALTLETAVNDPAGALPPGLALRAALEEKGDGYQGEVTLTSEASALRSSPLCITAEGDGHHVDGSRLAGRLALHELTAMRFWPATLRSLAGELELDGTLSGPLGAPRFGGQVAAEALGLERDGRTFRAESLRGDLDLSPEGLRLTNGSVAVWGTRAEIALDVPRDASTASRPAAQIQLVDAGPELVLDLASLSSLPWSLALARDGSRPPEERWISRDLRVSGVVELGRDLAATGSLAVETRETAALLTLALGADGNLRGSRLSGRLSWVDLLLLGIFSEGLRPLAEGTASLEAEILGTRSAPVLRGRLAATAMRVDLSGLHLPLQDLSTELHLDHESLVAHEVSGRVGGGRFGGEVVIGFGGGFSGFDVSLSASGIDLATLALPDLLRGRGEGELRLRRRAGEPMTGGGDLVITEPRYPGLRAAEGRLREWGLPLPSLEGTAPLRARYRIQGPTLLVDELEARLASGELRGRGAIGPERALRGDTTLHVAQRYLRQSVLLTIPSWLTGDLEVPLHLHGTLDHPAIDADFARAVREAIGHGPVVSTVSQAAGGVAQAARGVVDTLDDLFSGGTAREKSPAPRPTREEAEIDRLVDRIMGDDEDSERLIDALIDAGVGEDDIVRALERWRRRRDRPA